MKNDPDINQTLLDQGADAVRRRHDGAQKFNGDLGALPADRSEHGGPHAPERTKSRRPKFQLVAFKDIRLDTERRNYLIKGLLPDRGLVVMWGPPKCYKSFCATDMGLHISLGWEYRGRRVQQATVVYCALEGKSSQPDRFGAFKQHYKIEEAPFYLITEPLDLISEAQKLITDIETQLDGVCPGVIIDTLNRSLVGSEFEGRGYGSLLGRSGQG